MQLLSCHIAIAGDDNSIIVRDTDNPVTYPEMLVLKALHGGEHVRHIEDIGEVERDNEEERARLNEIYGLDIVRQCFPGVGDVPEKDAKIKVRKVEVTKVEVDAKSVSKEDNVLDEDDKDAPKQTGRMPLQRDKHVELPSTHPNKK
jgi:hypothetical protein